jgi:hypothetical protein
LGAAGSAYGWGSFLSVLRLRGDGRMGLDGWRWLVSQC